MAIISEHAWSWVVLVAATAAFCWYGSAAFRDWRIRRRFRKQHRR